MANIVNIAQPVTGQENASRIRPQTPNEGNHSIYQTPDPSKVQQSHDKNVYADRQNNPFSPNLDSNFDKFLQALRGTPDLAQQYGDLFFSKLGNLVNSGMGENFTAEVAKYMELMKMTDADLLAMIKGQQGSGVKFSGPFFDILRQIMNTNAPDDLKTSVLDFLRKYDSMTSNGHILKNIVSNLENIKPRIPASIAAGLETMIAKLDMAPHSGTNHGNLTVLKQEIMPFLANYVGRTKDYGAVRDLITMLTLNLARYESGTGETFVQALRNLSSYSQVNRHLPGVSVDVLAARLAAPEPPQPGAALLDALVDIIARGSKGEAGYHSREVFQNMVTSALLNESVYMPLVHVTIPADVDGKLLFSEMWIDPDDKSGSGGEGEEGGRAVKLLIKFDIKDLGYFEIILLAQEGKVDMQLYYPERLSFAEKDIRGQMSEIMTRNNMSFRSMMMARCETPKSISEVFPKLYERKNTINVTI